MNEYSFLNFGYQYNNKSPMSPLPFWHFMTIFHFLKLCRLSSSGSGSVGMEGTGHTNTNSLDKETITRRRVDSGRYVSIIFFNSVFFHDLTG